MDWKKRILRTLLLAAVGVCAGLGIGLMQAKKETATAPTPGIANIAGVGGPYTLTDQRGKLRTEADFKGQYKLIYFGFTYCPAICPTELQKMVLALSKSGPVGEKVTPIFITVDPDRDTQAIMKNYVELYSPRLIGLRGTDAQTTQVKKSFKVYAAKVPVEAGKDPEDYLVDHTSYIYFMGPDDTLIRLFRTEDTAAQIADAIKQAVPSAP